MTPAERTPGSALDPFDELLEESRVSAAVPVAPSKRDVHRHGFPLDEADVDVLQADEALDEEPRFGEEYERKGHLGYHQCAL